MQQQQTSLFLTEEQRREPQTLQEKTIDKNSSSRRLSAAKPSLRLLAFQKHLRSETTQMIVQNKCK